MALETTAVRRGARFAGPLPGRLFATTLAVAAAMGLLLGRFVLAGSTSAQPAPRAGATAATDTAGTIARLQRQLRTGPDDPSLLADLGVADLTRARETADPGFYTQAAQALERSQALAPDQTRTMTALGLLALARHDFAAALDWGERAHALEPDSADPLGVVVDASVEQGRYREATAAAQQMVDRRPSLASLSRASYLRELHGDQSGALALMTQAAAAGSGSAADLAYVQALVGDLRLGRGDLAGATVAYRRTLATAPGYGPAEVGLARVEGARGDLAGAARRLEPVADRLPFPATVALLGDLYGALGRGGDAARQYDLVHTIEELNRANGVAVDLELARFDADHARDPGGDPPAVVALARTALAQRPTVFAEDALGWALRQAGRPTEALPYARAAVALGTQDAILWYHLAVVEADLGQRAEAGADLARAFAINPYLTVRDRPAARDLAGRLGLPLP